MPGTEQLERRALKELDHEPSKGEVSPRAKYLREMYFDSKSSVSMEFPYWYTRRWNELDGELTIIRKAEALKTAFSHLTPTIFPKETLVGGRTIYLRGSFPMPWVLRSYYLKDQEEYKKAKFAGKVADEAVKVAEGGGNVTSAAGNVSSVSGKFGLRAEEVPIFEKTAGDWTGRSVEDVALIHERDVPRHEEKVAIMRNLVCMYDSGYTNPQGREVVSYYYPLQYGIDGIIKEAQKKIEEIAGIAGEDPIVGIERLYFYKAIKTTLEGIKKWLLNYAEEARRLASTEEDEVQKSEYKELRDRLEYISSGPPRTFQDALQLVWIFHLAIMAEDTFSGLAPGRLGQVLYPWWEVDMRHGRIDPRKTVELLECMRVKFTEIDFFGSKKVIEGIQAGSTFNHVCLGGLTRDGRAVANELERYIIEAGVSCQTPQPTLTVLYDELLPEDLLLKAIDSDKTGVGYPAWVNNRVAIEYLMKNYAEEGLTIEEARAVSIGGCLQTNASTWMPIKLDGKDYEIPCGAQFASDVGVHFLNLPKLLLLALFDGVDPRSGERIFPSHGQQLSSYDEVWNAFKLYFDRTVDVLIRCNNIQHDVWRKMNPPVVNSLMKADAFSSGKDLGRMGAKYNSSFSINITGGVNLVNSLASIKLNVYDRHSFSLEDLKKALLGNFGYRKAEEVNSYSLFDQVRESHEWDAIHRLCLHAPKFGNDDPYVDGIFKQFQEFFRGEAHGHRSMFNRPLTALQLSVTTHGPLGAVTIATPDGRLEGTTFADASVSAFPGTDISGPYALFSSATCFDHSDFQCTQLNMKIHPTAVRGREGSKKFLELVRAYMRRGGFHIQFNIVDSKMLRDAQAHPENYRTLMIRVAGFTHYWVELPKPIQDEIIARTEYEGVA